MDPLNLFKNFTQEEIASLISLMRNTRGNWARTPEDSRRKGEATRKVWESYTPKEKEERMEKTFNNPEAKEKAAEGRRVFLEKLTPKEMEEWVSKSFQQEGAAEKRGESHRRLWAGYTQEEREARTKNSFNSDEAFLKSAQSRKRPPSKPEVFLGALLEELYSGMFGYNGDGRLNVSVGHRIPDYINLEGKKEAISVMGGLGYLHSYMDDTAEVRYYRERGWDILVVWDYELYLGEALEKIKTFVEKGGDIDGGWFTCFRHRGR